MSSFQSAKETAWLCFLVAWFVVIVVPCAAVAIIRLAANVILAFLLATTLWFGGSRSWKELFGREFQELS